MKTKGEIETCFGSIEWSSYNDKPDLYFKCPKSPNGFRIQDIRELRKLAVIIDILVDSYE